MRGAETNGLLRYVIQPDDLDQVGIHKLNAEVTFSSSILIGDKNVFTVLPIFDDN